MSEKILSKKLIYSLFTVKLDALREYLNLNLKSRLILELIFSTEYPIIFVPKKNGTLRLYVDYQELNNITIKKSALLLLILELQDRL